MKYKNIYKSVNWVSEVVLFACANKWNNLFSNEVDKKFDESDRAELRDILLSIYKPFLQAVSGDPLYMFQLHKWNVRYLEKLDWSNDMRSFTPTTSEIASQIYLKPPAVRVLAEGTSGISGNPLLSDPIFVGQVTERTLIYPPKTKVTVTTPCPPHVIAMIDLAASDIDIQDQINHWRKNLKIEQKKDTKGRKKSSGRRKGSKVEWHYFDMLILLQIGKNEAETLALIKELHKVKLGGLTKATFSAQVKSLLNFVDPNSIGHQNGKLKATP